MVKEKKNWNRAAYILAMILVWWTQKPQACENQTCPLKVNFALRAE